MYKYVFSINNETNLTYQNARNFISKHFSILTEQEDHLPPHYSLTSLHLNTEENPKIAWQKGLALNILYNGITRLLYFYPLNEIPIEERIRITEMYLVKNDKNLTENHFFDLLPVYPFDKSITFTESIKKNETKHQFNNLLNSAFDNERIYGLLLQLGVGLNWINLYSILDTIKYLCSDYDKLVSLTNYTTKDIGLFTHTANNFGQLSFYARHGEQGWTPPTKSLDIRTAQDMILSLTRAYFKETMKLEF